MDCMNLNIIENHSIAQSSLAKRKMYRGICYFAMFTVVGLAILFYTTSTPQTLSAFTRLDYRYFILATLLVVVDILLGAWRNHVLVQKIKPGVKLWLCLKAQLANEFGSAVTPGQGGGGPAWLYVLYRGGISLAPAIAVSVIIFLSTLFFYQVTTAVSLVVLNDRFSGESLLYLLHIGFLISMGMFLLVLFSLCMPQRMSRFITAVSRPLINSGKPWASYLSRIVEQITDVIRKYYSSCMLIFRNFRLSVFKTFLITGLYFLNKLILAYIIILGLGVQVNFVTAIAILALLRFILYFTPTPGGSGVGEISIAILMSALLPMYLLPVYTVLYRSFQLFLPSALGAWVLLKELRAVTLTEACKEEALNAIT